MRDSTFALIAVGVAAISVTAIWVVPDLVNKKKAPPVVPTKKAELVAPAYVWVDNTGFLTFGQLRDVPPECFHGFDTIKGWAHGLIKRPVVGKGW